MKVGVEKIIKPKSSRFGGKILHPQSLVKCPFPEELCAFNKDGLPCDVLSARVEIRICKIHRQRRLIVVCSRAEQFQLLSLKTQLQIREKPGISKEQTLCSTCAPSEVTAAIKNGESFAILEIA